MRLRTRELVLFGLLGGMTFGAKVAMMGLPNIEPVSLMVMLFAVSFGRKAVYPIYTYVLLEFALNGINLWSVNYLYIWLLLAAAAWTVRDMASPVGWAVLSGAPVYLFAGGPAFALSWWLSGIPYDLLHCAGNFVLALVLFVPLRKRMSRLG